MIYIYILFLRVQTIESVLKQMKVKHLVLVLLRHFA